MILVLNWFFFSCRSGKDQLAMLLFTQAVFFYIAVCAAGSYRSDNQCFLCPLGQYQPRRGQTQCLQCGPGQTTVLEGSRRAADCVEGNVDECQTNVAQCGPNTICIDTPKSYECKCAEGSTLQKNGNCTGKSRIYICIFLWWLPVCM